MTATIQIPNLPAGVALNGQEQFEAVQAGVSVRLTAAQIATYGASFVTTGAIVAKTNNYNILSADTLTTFTNQGAGTGIILSLPTSPVGGELYSFAVTDPHIIRVVAGPAAVIALGALVSSVGGYVEADGASGGLNSFLTLRALSTTLWMAQTISGSWMAV